MNRGQRWLIFYLVGAMGIFIQMSVLFVLTSFTGLGYLAATGLAVEAAILHNFLWHEHWTWSDRGPFRGHLLRHFLGFHLANGAISLIGNLVLTRFFVERLGVNFMFANALAIALCSVLNFLAADCLVFRTSRRSRHDSQKEGTERREKSPVVAAPIFLFFSISLTAGFSTVRAAELQPETIRAWNESVQQVERRISNELASQKGFLALDFQDPSAAEEERKEVFSGKIPVKQVSDSQAVKIPNGMIHHWRGVVFISGVTLDSVMARIGNPRPEDARQEDVLESRVLENHPGQLRLYLKLQRSKIVTVVYSTEHLVRYGRLGTNQGSSSSVATKIAEIENFREGTEREMPEGHGHGYLWRMNSYWRYEEVKGGVIVECESITLSRSIPAPLEYLIRPLIHSVARESMRRTLGSMRARMINSRFEIRDTKLKTESNNLEFRISDLESFPVQRSSSSRGLD